MDMRKEEDMFSVFLTHLDSSCEKLQYLAGKRYSEIQEIEKVISELSSLSEMDKIISQLKIQKKELEEQQQDLLDMIQGLMKIRRCYSTAENRICENGEECRVRYKYLYRVERFSMFAGNSEGLTPIIIT